MVVVHALRKRGAATRGRRKRFFIFALASSGRLAVAGLDVDAPLFVIVEQDLYPCEPAVPLPIATRTRAYLNGRGLTVPPGMRP